LDHGANSNDHNSLTVAILNSRVDQVKLLLDYGPNNNAIMETCFHVSLNIESIRIVKLLIHYGADVNVKNSYLENSLFIYLKRSTLSTVKLNTNIDMVKLLINSGCELNVINTHGKSLFGCALLTNNVNIVQLLLENNIDINIQVNKGENGLWLSNSYSFVIFELLLEYGIDVNAYNSYSYPLFNEINNYTYNYVKVKTLIQYGANINFIINNETPLYIAVKLRDGSVMDLLLENKAKVNLLNLAITENYFYGFIKLLEYGADPNFRHIKNNTCLINAILNNNSDTHIMVKLLL